MACMRALANSGCAPWVLTLRGAPQSRVPLIPNITSALHRRKDTPMGLPRYFFSGVCFRVMTWSMMPYSSASSADMKKLRSESVLIFSTS